MSKSLRVTLKCKAKNYFIQSFNIEYQCVAYSKLKLRNGIFEQTLNIKYQTG